MSIATTEEPATASSLNSSGVYQKLLERLQDRPPEWMQRITAHVRETSGHNTLVNFQQSAVPEAQKIKTYACAMMALVAAEAAEKIGSLNDREKALKAAWSGLAGQEVAAPKPLTRDQLAEEQFNRPAMKPYVPKAESVSAAAPSGILSVSLLTDDEVMEIWKALWNYEFILQGKLVADLFTPAALAKQQEQVRRALEILKKVAP